MVFGRSSSAVFLSPGPDSRQRAYSEQRLQAPVRLRVRARVGVESACDADARMPVLRLTGDLWVRGPELRFSFRPEASVPAGDRGPIVADCPLVPLDAGIPIPGHLVKSTRPGRPLVWVGFLDAYHVAIGTSICLGRLEDGRLRYDSTFEMVALAATRVTAHRMDQKGAVLGLAGELTMPRGVVMRVTLAPSCDRFGGPAERVEAAEIEVVPCGKTLAIRPHTVSATVVGHPLVCVALRDWHGRSPGAETTVGRLATMR